MIWQLACTDIAYFFCRHSALFELVLKCSSFYFLNSINEEMLSQGRGRTCNVLNNFLCTSYNFEPNTTWAVFGPISSTLLRNIQQDGVTQDIILKIFFHEEYTPFSFR